MFMASFAVFYLIFVKRTGTEYRYRDKKPLKNTFCFSGCLLQRLKN